MLKDPLFIQTKSDLEKWRKSKETSRARIPLPIKKNILQLCKKYPSSEIISAFSLSGCSARFIKRGLEQNPPVKFLELPTNNLMDLKSSSKIEIDLPLNITLRIFL